MAIKNTLFIRYIVSITLSLLIVGCQHFQQTKPQQLDQPQEVSNPPPQLNIPEFVGKRAPTVGIILGPGGAKSFAHIGVLQELEKHKVQIKAVAGLEWGALIGGLYALNGEVHEVDWKVSQIPKLNFAANNFFSRKLDPLPTKEFDPYLTKVFRGVNIQKTKLPFACPYIAGTSGRTRMARRGSAKGLVKACWQYPPIFQVSSSMGAPFALEEAASFLREQGAELIILVDVLGRADQKDFSNWSQGDWSWFAWTSVQEAISKSKYFGIHEVIKVETTSYSMVDVEQRLRLIQLGKQESAASIEKIVEKYDF